MNRIQKVKLVGGLLLLAGFGSVALFAPPGHAQLPDRTVTPNAAGEGINKSYAEQIGAGRGDLATPGSSAFIIARDPFRSIRRGRQVFQRKFTRAQGVGPLFGDGLGNIEVDLAIGAGLADSCASCHGRPRGSAGFGGDVVTRPDSRDAPHLFGLGLKEMLADEMTADLRAIRQQAVAQAQGGPSNKPVTRQLTTKGVNFGVIKATRHGNNVSVDTSGVEGVNADLRVRPFFFQGGTISMREFLVGAFNAEMGLQSVDPELKAAAAGAHFTTPSGMVLDGSTDAVEAPPTDSPTADPDGDGVTNEVPTSIVDHMEFYLLNYFKPGLGEQTAVTAAGRQKFMQIGCAQCHVPDLQIDRDRRVADVETVHDPVNGIFNSLFATAAARFAATDDGSGHPTLKRPSLQPFLVRNFFSDLKRHDLGPNFWERNYNGGLQKEFLTIPLWGVGSTSPYGHDGRSVNLKQVILRHGGEAQAARDAFAALSPVDEANLLVFLSSLVLFPPDDTVSNLNPGDRNAPNFPQAGHGSIRLPALFNNPLDIE
ncbi:MAG TPA: di-heme oxidoredictase family protein [Pyrinomonadaceae bacterium]|nr:di-heme oxidoredictase family protein [Pyrinomonadaceae bacterium]